LVCSLSPMVSVCSVAIGIYMKYKPDKIVWDVVWLISGLLIMCAIGATYYANFRPLRDPASNGRLLLDTFAGQIIAYGKSKNVKLRLNILIVRRGIWFFNKSFKIAWASWNKTKDFYPDGAVSFDVEKGIAGYGYKQKIDLLVDMEEPANRDKDWGFTAEEKEAFPEHTMIWSFPIYEVNKEGDMTGKILGMLNLDSQTRGAFKIVLTDEEFRNRMVDFREIACKVTSV
jgi:hypothetical protein